MRIGNSITIPNLYEHPQTDLRLKSPSLTETETPLLRTLSHYAGSCARDNIGARISHSVAVAGVKYTRS